MCSLFGLIDFRESLSQKQQNKVITVLSKECEVRGTDATGISYNYDGVLRVYKRPLPAHKLKFHIPKEATVIMGHTRMTTQGSEKLNYNNHPFVGRCEHTSFASGQTFALAHNGVLHNDVTLRKKHNLPKTNIETDSYIAVQLVEQNKTLNLESLKEMAEQVEGSFCFTVLDNENNLYLVKGESPIAIYKFKAGFYLYASTEEILKKALSKLRMNMPYEKVEMSCGDILKIDNQGFQEWEKFDISHLMSFDYSYLFNYGCNFNIPKISDDPLKRTLLDEIIDYAKSIGICMDDIKMLLEFGYDEYEIEELLYDPLSLQACLEEIYEGESQYLYDSLCY